jgi:hypothetical protein
MNCFDAACVLKIIMVHQYTHTLKQASKHPQLRWHSLEHTHRRIHIDGEREKKERITWMWRRSTTAWIDGSDDSLEEGCGWVGRSGAAVKVAEICVDAAGRDADGGTSADGTEPSGAEPAPLGGASSAADMAAPPHRAQHMQLHLFCGFTHRATITTNTSDFSLDKDLNVSFSYNTLTYLHCHCHRTFI